MEDNFSAKGFYEKLSNGHLCALRCKSCQRYVMPPTSTCSKCLSTNLEWVNLTKKGRVISFSEVAVASKQFQGAIPYVVSIIETDEGVRLAGVVKNAGVDRVKIGSTVSIEVPGRNQGDDISNAGFYFVLND